MKPKLRACPPVKHDPEAIKYSWGDNRAPPFWVVKCSCGLRGQEAATESEAIRLWNEGERSGGRR